MVLDVPLDRLRERRSVKWSWYPPDVLPLWIAEMDVDLAPPVHEVLERMVALSDTGYALGRGLPEAYAGFAARRWGLAVHPARTLVVQDVMRGVLEVLQIATEPGAGVVVNPPVYRPFYDVIAHARRRVVEVPLVADGSGRYGFDLDGLDAAFAAGAAAYLLCSPHNPVGRAWTRDELGAVAEIADRHGVLVLADEVHGPLVLPRYRFVPFASLDVAAARDAVSLTSASKAWNLAGLKAALVVAGSDSSWHQVSSLPVEVTYGTGILGVAASVAAFAEGEVWLDELVADVGRRAAELGDLLGEHLPEIRYRPPEATYLAWLDCRDVGLDDPQAAFLERGRVALEPGPKFGTGGEGFVRLNVAASPAVLAEAVGRMAAAVRGG